MKLINSARLQDTGFIYTNLLHFYTLIMKFQKEKVKKILFKITSKRIKYLGTNLTRGLKDLYSEHYKMVMKETEDDTKKWKAILCSWIEELILLKRPYYPRQSTDLMQSLSKYS